MSAFSLQAVIFDMDGVLIDSEPSWQQAELEVFNALGLGLEWQDTLQTTGLRIDQVVEYWYQRRPWQNYDNQAVSNAIADKMVQAILNDGQPLEGVKDALEACRALNLKVGLATSSPNVILQAVLRRLDIGHYFDAITSAEGLKYGKPHPEVYLNCAEELNVDPALCLAVEDSFNGIIAARAANMQTLAIPAAHEQTQARWIVAHHQETSLLALSSLLKQGFTL